MKSSKTSNLGASRPHSSKVLEASRPIYSSNLEFPYLQIVALYISRRKSLFRFIKVNHKTKDVVLSLKINPVIMCLGDELRFPNIETQQIYKGLNNNILMYPNRNIKYIYHHNHENVFEKSSVEDYSTVIEQLDDNIKKMNINIFKERLFMYPNSYSNINIIYNIGNSLNNLKYLYLRLPHDNIIEINLDLPNLLYLRIESKSTVNLFTPKLKILEKYKSGPIYIKEHSLIYIDKVDNQSVIISNTPFNNLIYRNNTGCYFMKSGKLLLNSYDLLKNLIPINMEFVKNYNFSGSEEIIENVIDDIKEPSIADEIDFESVVFDQLYL